MDKEQHVSWSEIDSLIERLSDLVLKSKKFSSITTLSRGGLVPSRLLADHLGIEKIFVDEKVIPANSLVVDDIFDSGKTFDRIISKSEDSSKLLYATLFARRGQKFPSQLIYAKETNNDGYIVFPWDKIEFEKSK
ncbi:MAG: phosphoribosyltransferase [Candidatus Nitrosopumilus sp. bin_7KS]